MTMILIAQFNLRGILIQRLPQPIVEDPAERAIITQIRASGSWIKPPAGVKDTYPDEIGTLKVERKGRIAVVSVEPSDKATFAYRRSYLDESMQNVVRSEIIGDLALFNV